MKRIFFVLVCTVLVMGSIACTKKEPAANGQAETSAAPEATAEAVVVVPTEEKQIISLDNLDYDAEKQTLIAKVTHMTFTPAATGELDTDYRITSGEAGTYAFAPNALIDFPLADNPATTVTLEVGELSDEFLNYKKANDGDLLFEMQLEGDVITKLVHFYLP